MTLEEYARKQAEKIKAAPNDETAQKVLEELYSLRAERSVSLTNAQREKILKLIIQNLSKNTLKTRNIHSEKEQDKVFGFVTTRVVCEASNDALTALLKAAENLETEAKK